MTGIQTWSTTAANNVQSATGINWDEGMSPGSVNNSARAVLADVRTAFNDLIWFQYGKGDGVYAPVYVASTQYKIAGVDVTAAYHVGRRTKAVGSGTGTIYGSISVTAFSTDTTVTVVWDSGSLTNEALTISLAQVPVTGKPVPPLAIAGSGTATTYLKGDGTWSAITAPTRQVLTSGSGATYTTPANVRQLRIRMVGGGGGGGGNSTDGAGSAGGAGGFSSFDNAGTNYKASGGSGGAQGVTGGNALGGRGGRAGTGGTSPNTIRYCGNAGQCGPSGFGSTSGNAGGNGGGSALGGASTQNAGAPDANTGAGGAGAATGTTTYSGGGGGSGEYVEIIINSPSGTYTYTIGAAGSAGTAGSGGGVGVAGASGVIIVDEIY